jgi:hypothetical protein
MKIIPLITVLVSVKTSCPVVTSKSERDSMTLPRLAEATEGEQIKPANQPLKR